MVAAGYLSVYYLVRSPYIIDNPSRYLTACVWGGALSLIGDQGVIYVLVVGLSIALMVIPFNGDCRTKYGYRWT